MQLRSLDKLDLDAAWRRVLHRMRSQVADVPDRLPFEIAERYWSENGPPRLTKSHTVRDAFRVPATKIAHQTVRPFVRVHPNDLLLYQALVDAMRDHIELNIGSREEVFGYRLSATAEEDAFADSPGWNDFEATLHQLALDELDGYVIQGDVASFFMNIDIPELGKRLLEAGCDGDVVRDLESLLAQWNHQGIRGLPQGVGPSPPLASFYLTRLDALLRKERRVSFVRYMDDFNVIAPNYRRAREVLDRMESHLYEEGLSLGGGKTKILRSENVLTRLTPQDEVEMFIDSLRDMADYEPDKTELEELEIEKVCEIFDGAYKALEADDYRRGPFTFALRHLGRNKNPHAVDRLPVVLLRMPGMTAPACRYFEAVSSASRADVTTALEQIIEGRFHRTQEWLQVLRATQSLPANPESSLGESLATLAENHGHELVRARALLAWGRQSGPDDFSAADRFYEKQLPPWLSYALVAIQGKERNERDRRYSKWGDEGRSLRWLAESIERQKFGWTKI